MKDMAIVKMTIKIIHASSLYTYSDGNLRDSAIEHELPSCDSFCSVENYIMYLWQRICFQFRILDSLFTCLPLLTWLCSTQYSFRFYLSPTVHSFINSGILVYFKWCEKPPKKYNSKLIERLPASLQRAYLGDIKFHSEIIKKDTTIIDRN